MAFSPAEKTRRYRERRLAEIEQMPKIPCACGCGTMISPINKQLKPAQYAHGHNDTGSRFKLGQEGTMKGRKNPGAAAAHRGKRLTLEEVARRTATRRANNGGLYQTKRGWKHSPEALERITEGNRRAARRGPDNHFFGKQHSAETRQRISEKLTGERNPGWQGGTGTLPYGPEFTRKFKGLIRERDNYTCQRCGKRQAEARRTFAVHHLDHDKMNNDPSNLVTSCHSCHRWAHWHPNEPFIP